MPKLARVRAEAVEVMVRRSHAHCVRSHLSWAIMASAVENRLARWCRMEPLEVRSPTVQSKVLDLSSLTITSEEPGCQGNSTVGVLVGQAEGPPCSVTTRNAICVREA